MPRPEYTNLSIDANKYDKIRGSFDRLKLDSSFSKWTIDLIQSGINRIKFLEKAYPHIKVISVMKGTIILEDENTKQIAKVYLEDYSIKCTIPDNQDYILYAVIHPEFSF